MYIDASLDIHTLHTHMLWSYGPVQRPFPLRLASNEMSLPYVHELMYGSFVLYIFIYVCMYICADVCSVCRIYKCVYICVYVLIDVYCSTVYYIYTLIYVCSCCSILLYAVGGGDERALPGRLSGPGPADPSLQWHHSTAYRGTHTAARLGTPRPKEEPHHIDKGGRGGLRAAGTQPEEGETGLT